LERVAAFLLIVGLYATVRSLIWFLPRSYAFDWGLNDAIFGAVLLVVGISLYFLAKRAKR